MNVNINVLGVNRQGNIDKGMGMFGEVVLVHIFDPFLDRGVFHKSIDWALEY